MTKLLRLAVAVSIATAMHFTANSQSVSINTTGATANTSSILDVSSTAKGVLIPRMSKIEKNAIGTPATGLLIFQATPDSTGFYYYNGVKWVWLTDGTNADTTAWKITGNSNIKSSNFLGTLNDTALRFRIRNIPSGILDSTLANTGLGYKTMNNMTTGNGNTALGYRALDSTKTGIWNTATWARTTP